MRIKVIKILYKVIKVYYCLWKNILFPFLKEDKKDVLQSF